MNNYQDVTFLLPTDTVGTRGLVQWCCPRDCANMLQVVNIEPVAQGGLLVTLRTRSMFDLVAYLRDLGERLHLGNIAYSFI